MTDRIDDLIQRLRAEPEYTSVASHGMDAHVIYTRDMQDIERIIREQAEKRKADGPGDRIDDLIRRLREWWDKPSGWAQGEAIIRQWAGEQKEAVKKSSEEWSKLLPEWRVIDPDGWDRKNLEASWSELITESEYMRRVYQSTCMPMATPQPVAGAGYKHDPGDTVGEIMDELKRSFWTCTDHYAEDVARRIIALLRPEPPAGTEGLGLREAAERALADFKGPVAELCKLAGVHPFDLAIKDLEAALAARPVEGEKHD